MKHLVFGTGLIGGFIAGGLIKAGLKPLLLGRDKQRAAMRQGLTISDLNGHSANLEAPTFLEAQTFHTPETSKGFDVIWLTVKAVAVQNCIAQLRQLVTPNSIIICCQNGFGSDDVMRNALPDSIVLTAIVGFNVAQTSGSHLHRSTDGNMVIEAHPAIEGLAKQLHCELLPVIQTANIEAQRWAKLQLNLANPVNALADLPTKRMLEDAAYRRVIAALMKELLNVTQAKQVKLPKLTALPAWLLPFVMRLPNGLYLKLAQKTLAIDPSARASMWWDLSQGKQSEIHYLNKTVVEHGQALGIKCPYNEHIVQLITDVEQGNLKLGISGIELQQRLKMI